MVIVNVKQGSLEGEKCDLVTGDGKYYSFKGIPYAKPPLGKLRFKAPQPPESWTGVRKCLKHGPSCHQFDIFTGKIAPGSEDCLYLNVYSPNLNPVGKLAPVMFWIHGGGFKSGNGNSDVYGPDFLVRQGIVIVTINYRLEVLGFLCLDTEEVPGNAGLKDQVAALRWVKDNISSFGGDRDNVTIFGESAGGASVGYHLMSPLSSGLFKKAILMSGVPLCDWASTFKPKIRALKLAQLLGSKSDDPAKVLEYLQTVPMEKLIKQDLDILLLESQGQVLETMFFSPVVEKDFGIDQQFLTRPALEYVNLGKLKNVDIMMGYTSEEGIIVNEFISGKEEFIDRHIECLLPREVAFNSTTIRGFELAQKIREYYFSANSFSIENVQNVAKCYSWSVFKYNIHRFLRYLVKSTSSKQYFYKFSCLSERNFYGNLASAKHKLDGVSHLDDLSYLFDQKMHNLPLDKNNKIYTMILQTTALWTNFAKYGDPTPDSSLGVKWLPYTSEKEDYLDIDEKLTPGMRLGKEDVSFWDTVYKGIY